jgi:hypothetical protein
LWRCCRYRRILRTGTHLRVDQQSKADDSGRNEYDFDRVTDTGFERTARVLQARIRGLALRLSATIFFEIDAARLALDFAELFMAALGAIHTILGATASEKEAETIVSIPRNLCDEPHDTAVVNAAKTGSTPERIEPQAASRRGLGLEHFVLYGHSWGGILGKSEFLVTGNLKNWERWDRLHEIKVKALTIGAQYDEMDPEDMKKMAGLMPNAGYAFCPNGSHLCMWDDQEAYFKHLLNFLHEV